MGEAIKIEWTATPAVATGYEIIRAVDQPLDGELCPCGELAVGALTNTYYTADGPSQTQRRAPYCAAHGPRG